MSGGVDSSVSAALLKDQGYNVVGVYMKNWSRDLPGMVCPWARDLADAKRVATRLDIDFRVFDFEKEYKHKVVDYMLSEFKKGNTPNPDIMCNQEIKFKLFAETAFEQGADLIATGHYARVLPGNIERGDQASDKLLARARDENKDQTYFLYRAPQEAISKTLFPLGNLTKPEVKQIAKDRALHIAAKKESMGVCFVGEVGIRDFLSSYIKAEPGEIRELETDKVLGSHDGAIFFTLGQRHGLSVGGGLPYYVAKKDIDKNIVYVSSNLNSPALWTKELKLKDIFWRVGEEKDQSIEVRLRHRAPLQPATLKGDALTFADPVKTPPSGQSAVFYSGEICLGGGIVA
jgi:tRNA-specific 2-thiouridylase